jgi:hypothetical protein
MFGCLDCLRRRYWQPLSSTLFKVRRKQYFQKSFLAHLARILFPISRHVGTVIECVNSLTPLASKKRTFRHPKAES